VTHSLARSLTHSLTTPASQPASQPGMPAGMGAQRRRRLLLAACCCCCCCLLAARRAQGFLLLPPSAPRTRSLEAAGGGGGPGKVQEFREQEQQEAAAAPLACSRKAFFALAAGLWVALPPAQSFAEALTEGGKVQLTKADIEVAKQAFALFDKRQLGLAEKVFTDAISRWEKTDRPKDEVISLIKARGNVRVDIKKFSAAIEDYDLVVAMMQADGAERPEDGTSRYGEYPDTFVQRGLAREGLADWEGAIEDYSKAVKLWGGGRGEGINPYVLTFRANALGRLQRYADALLDYEAAEKLFTLQKDADRALDARANTALVLFQVRPGPFLFDSRQ
jgi:tetratricopeptide (TPR) repeat protein